MKRATLRFGAQNGSSSAEDSSIESSHHLTADGAGEITCKVKIRLRIDPKDGSVVHRDVDLDVEWDEIGALEESILAGRDA